MLPRIVGYKLTNILIFKLTHPVSLEFVMGIPDKMLYEAY
jgi:hypothetical protein